MFVNIDSLCDLKLISVCLKMCLFKATDMEIEEWQNAYEFQARKVSQLEILVKGKTKAHDLQQTRVKELEAQIIDLKNSVWTFEVCHFSVFVLNM